MSKSVVPAAAVAHAKRLVQNKKFAKQHEAQQPAKDEPQAADHKDEAANVVHRDAQPQSLSMSDATLGGFSFSGALADAASSAASLTVATSAQEDGGYSDSDNGSDGSGTILLVGAVGLVGAGIAVLASGGGKGNEGPSITSGDTATVAENAAATTVVYTAAATDPDGDAITYSLSGTDAAAFDINASTGAVTLKAPADFETKSSYSFNVVASDGSISATKAVTLTVTNVPEAPVFTSGATAAIDENEPTETVVYTAAVTGSGATYALAGDDAAAFDIDAATGKVTFKASPDYEAQSSYDIVVVATQDGMTSEQAVAITINDVEEPGPSFTSGGAAEIAENQPASTVVYDADATGSGTIAFALTGTDADLFNIDPVTGEVTLKSPADFETKAEYNFNVTATDDNGVSSQAVVLTITDVEPEDAVTTVSLDDLPGMTQTISATVDASAGAVVYTNDVTKTSNVVIQGFSEDDVIHLTGLTDLDTLNYTTNGAGEGANDLRIDWQNLTTNTVETIIIEDAIVNAGGIYSYATAMAAVGFDFMTIA